MSLVGHPSHACDLAAHWELFCLYHFQLSVGAMANLVSYVCTGMALLSTQFKVTYYVCADTSGSFGCQAILDSTTCASKWFG